MRARPYADPNRYADGNANAYPNANGDPDAHPNANTHGDCNPNPNAHTNTHRYADGNGNANARSNAPTIPARYNQTAHRYNRQRAASADPYSAAACKTCTLQAERIGLSPSHSYSTSVERYH